MKKIARKATIKKALCGVFAALVLLAGCTPGASSAAPGGSSAVQSTAPPSASVVVQSSTLTPQEEYPRVDGSTATLPLMAEVYAQRTGAPPEEAETMVEASGTASAWRSLAGGESDLLMVYEAPGEVVQELGESYEALEMQPIGRDGLVFIVNKNNPVQSLTTAQLRDIYSGKITNWSEVGGEDVEIVPFQRNETSGSHTLFLKLLMGDTPPMQAPSEQVAAGMGGLIDVLASFDGDGSAIGYSVFYYASEMYQNPELKMIEVEGVAPAAESIGDESYPLVNDFYAAIRKDEPENSAARQLYNWLLGSEGRDAIKKAGYVPV